MLSPATTNPAKIQAILRAFNGSSAKDPAIESISVEVVIAEQPFGNEKRMLAHRNRVANARAVQPNADFWVAIEARIDEGSTFSAG